MQMIQQANAGAQHSIQGMQSYTIAHSGANIRGTPLQSVVCCVCCTSCECRMQQNRIIHLTPLTLWRIGAAEHLEQLAHI